MQILFHFLMLLILMLTQVALVRAEMVKEGLTALAVPLDEVNIIRVVMVVWM